MVGARPEYRRSYVLPTLNLQSLVTHRCSELPEDCIRMAWDLHQTVEWDKGITGFDLCHLEDAVC